MAKRTEGRSGRNLGEAKGCSGAWDSLTLHAADRASPEGTLARFASNRLGRQGFLARTARPLM